MLHEPLHASGGGLCGLFTAEPVAGSFHDDELGLDPGFLEGRMYSLAVAERECAVVGAVNEERWGIVGAHLKDGGDAFAVFLGKVEGREALARSAKAPDIDGRIVGDHGRHAVGDALEGIVGAGIAVRPVIAEDQGEVAAGAAAGDAQAIGVRSSSESGRFCSGSRIRVKRPSRSR